MIRLPEINGEVQTIAGIADTGETVQGTTTNETINAMFGDLWSGDAPITDAEFQAIISRCESNGWQAWKATWQMWRDQGLLN